MKKILILLLVITVSYITQGQNSAKEIQRTVIVEQFTTESCPNCPPVLTLLENHMDENPNFILMCHHAGYYTDDYTIPESIEHTEFFNDGGSTYAPAGMVDRHYNGLNNDNMWGVDPGPVFWDGNPYGPNRIDERTAIPAYVDISINGTNNAGELSLTLTADFLADFTHEMGLSLWITEDSIGTTTQSGATEWIHRYTIRDAISERLGDSIKCITDENTSFSKDYTFTIDPTWDESQLYLVAMVGNISNDVNDREIHNAKQIHLSDLQTIEKQTVTLEVTNTEGPVENAIIDINGMQIETDGSGVGQLELPEGNFAYTVEKEGYGTVSGIATVENSQVTVPINLQMVQTVYFTVQHGTQLMEGVNIQIDILNLTTDEAGEASIELPLGTYNYTATYEGYNNYNGTVTLSDEDIYETISMSEIGISNTNLIDFSVYPNPSKGIIHIDINGNGNLSVVNALGKTVLEKKITGDKVITMKELSSGIYFINITSMNKTKTRKVIIQ